MATQCDEMCMFSQGLFENNEQMSKSIVKWLFKK